MGHKCNSTEYNFGTYLVNLMIIVNIVSLLCAAVEDASWSKLLACSKTCIYVFSDSVRDSRWLTIYALSFRCLSVFFCLLHIHHRASCVDYVG